LETILLKKKRSVVFFNKIQKYNLMHFHVKKNNYYKRVLNIENFSNKNIQQKKRGGFLCCIINIKHTVSNFFIVITDLDGKVIGYCSAGQVSDSNNVKKKRSFFLVNPMMNRLVLKLRKLNIKHIRVRIRSNVTHHTRKILEFLKNGGFRIQHIVFAKPIPHHFGQRRRKLKRL